MQVTCSPSFRNTLWKKVKLLKMSNFTFFHNVFFALYILKYFNSHISVLVCSYGLKRENIMVTRIFSFSHSVFKSIFPQKMNNCVICTNEVRLKHIDFLNTCIISHHFLLYPKSIFLQKMNTSICLFRYLRNLGTTKTFRFSE